MNAKSAYRSSEVLTGERYATKEQNRKRATIMKSRRRHSRLVKNIPACLLFLALFCSATLTSAQEPTNSSNRATMPDSPAPKASTNTAVQTTTRFVGYMTNRSLIFPDIAYSAGPLTSEQKFKLFMNQSVSPPYVFISAFSAAYDQARNSPKAYGQGWAAYGQRFGADVARASSNSFFSSFALASVLHQDPRFFPQSHPTIWSSIKYSAQRVFVTRTDSGRDAFNSSSILGTFAAEGLANAYLPTSEQTAAKNFERIGTDLAWKFAANMFKNYWPTIFRTAGLHRLKVISDPDLSGLGVPE
jgi:hypothetical protein